MRRKHTFEMGCIIEIVQLLKFCWCCFMKFLPVCNFSSHWAPTYTQPEEHMTAKSFYSFSSSVTLVAFRFLTRKVSSCLGEGVICYFSLLPHPLLKEYLLKNKFWFYLRTLPPKNVSQKWLEIVGPPPSRKFRQKGVADLERTPTRVKSVQSSFALFPIWLKW